MIKRSLIPALVLLASTSVYAEIISPLDTSFWTVLTNGSEDQTTYKLTPGYGGQLFDAEYLLYNYDSSSHVLSLALQTGFDVTGDNKIQYSNDYYWGGDLALSFNGVTLGDSSTYEYAIDFGQVSGGYNDRGSSVGPIAAHTAGLYKVTNWSADNAIYYQASNPFVMTSGNLDASVTFSEGSGVNLSGAEGSNSTSYYKTMSFDLDNIDGLILADISSFDAHWTMSCGNDAIDGYAEINAVSEPHVLLLFSTGLLGLITGMAVRRKRQLI